MRYVATNNHVVIELYRRVAKLRDPRNIFVRLAKGYLGKNCAVISVEEIKCT